MSKFISDTVYDAALTALATAVQIRYCDGQPASWADCLSRTLGFSTVSGGSWTNADGDTSGRKTTLAAISSVAITRTGTLDHVVAITSSALLGATTHATLGISSGDVRNFNAVDFLEIRDPT